MTYGETVSDALPTMLPDVALTVVVCVAVMLLEAVNRPLLSIVPAFVFDDFQVTESVISWVTPPVVVAVAVYCCVAPALILVLEGVTVIFEIFAKVTVTEVEPVTVPEVAVIVALPVLAPVTNPLELIEAIVVSEVDHWTLPVRVFVLPSS